MQAGRGCGRYSAPQAIQRLHDVKDALVDGPANDYQRKKLGAALDAQIVLVRDNIGRHAAAQSKVWQQQVALDRIGLLAKEAAFHRNDDSPIDVLSQAASTAARAQARVGEADPSPEIEERAATLARSQILASALRAHIDSGNIDDATRLYDRVRNQLVEDHAQSVGGQIQTLPRVDNIEVASYSDKAYAARQVECVRKYEKRGASQAGMVFRVGHAESNAHMYSSLLGREGRSQLLVCEIEGD